MKNVKKMLLGLVLGFMLLGNAGAMQGAGPAAAQNQQNVVQPPLPLMPAINQLTQAIERRGPLVILTINERFKKKNETYHWKRRPYIGLRQYSPVV